MKAELTIIHQNGLEQVKEVILTSNELISIKKEKNKKLYVTVRPRISESGKKGKKKKLMFYSRFGEPFTFDPFTGDIFSDKKKKNILIENGLGYPLIIGSKKIIILFKQNEDGKINRDGEPDWKQESIARYQELIDTPLKNMAELEKWLNTHQELISEERYHEIPAYTEYDLSKIDMCREENYQLIESDTICETMKSMSGIGKKMDHVWIFLIFGVVIVLMMLIFFFFANDGVFNQGVTKEVIEKVPEEGLSLFRSRKLCLW